MNLTILRLRYTQFFVVCLLSISFCTLAFSWSGDIQNFGNHLWNRKLFINTFTKFKLTLGDQVFPQVLVNKEHWFEYTGDKNLDDYQNAIAISPEELKTLRQKIQSLYKQLKKRNITLLIVVAPNKATIYPDKLPDSIQKLAPQSKLDLLTDYLNKHGPSVMVDLRPALKTGRKKQDVYYTTDTHWNAYGAFIAYTEIMKRISETYPQLAPKKHSEFTVQTYPAYVHDIPAMIGANNLQEINIQFIPKVADQLQWTTLNDDKVVPMQIATAPNKDLPILLIYMDSFGNGLKNFIAPHFRQTTLIQNSTSKPTLISMQEIDKVHPDIVILEFVERGFTYKRLYGFLQQFLSKNEVIP